METASSPAHSCRVWVEEEDGEPVINILGNEENVRRVVAVMEKEGVVLFPRVLRPRPFDSLLP